MTSLLKMVFRLAIQSLFSSTLTAPGQLLQSEQNPVLEQSLPLHKRDSCTDAFGSGWLGNTCTPGSTFCCVNHNQRYPQCSQYLGLGWCCTEQGGCYVDLTSSACGQPGAVSCTQLASGVDKACCPQYTTCAPGYNASTSWVRCNIQQSSLQSLASSTSVLSGASTNSQPVTGAALPMSSSSHAAAIDPQTSPTSAPSLTPVVPTPTTSTTNTVTSEPPIQRAHLNPGSIAGLVVGSAAGALLLVFVSVLWKRRSAKSKSLLSVKANVDRLPVDPPAYNSACYAKAELYPRTPKQELAARWSRTRSPVELPIERF